MDQETKHEHCLNCGSRFPEAVSDKEEIYCSQCGQSSRDSKLSFGRLIKDAISNVFNLDSRLIHTFRDILFPSKLTRSYIEGRRKYYVNPVRLFIFTLLGLITLSLYSINIENSAMGADRIYTKAERSKVLDEYTTLIDSIDISGHETFVDSLKSKLFNRDRSLDSDTLGRNGPDLFGSGERVRAYGISSYDGIHLTQKELFEKYKVEGFWDKICVGQYIRVATNPAGGIKYGIKNLTWAIFISVFLLSFVMKLLYIRNQYYLVEHMVLILNGHSMLFFFVALNIIISVHIPLGIPSDLIADIGSAIIFLSVFIIQFLSLRNYYRQGKFKTLVKQFIFNFVYLFIFIMVVFLVAIISLILY